jgi:protein-S-isoprenylcysteine O-methyltransferase Ste14
MEKATKFEYRHRYVILALIYASTYILYGVDRINIVWALGHWNRAHTIPLDAQVFTFAAIVAGAGVVLWTWARAYVPVDSDETTLVEDGPYRYVRNPLYLSGLLLAIGFGFFQSRLGFVLLIPLELIFVCRLIAFEESELQQRYGEAFLAYCRQVPRLLPTFSPWPSDATGEPKWRQAITHDLYLWGYVVTLIAFAVTLNDKVGHRFTATTLCVWLLQKAYRAAFGKRSRMTA